MSCKLDPTPDETREYCGKRKLAHTEDNLNAARHILAKRNGHVASVGMLYNGCLLLASVFAAAYSSLSFATVYPFVGAISTLFCIAIVSKERPQDSSTTQLHWTAWGVAGLFNLSQLAVSLGLMAQNAVVNGAFILVGSVLSMYLLARMNR